MMRRAIPIAAFIVAAVGGAAAAARPVGRELAGPAADDALQHGAAAEVTGTAVPAAGGPSPELTALRAELDRLIDGAGWRGDSWSVLAVSLDRGDTLYARDARAALAPASNMKLFTTAAALYYLGPDFRYGTFLMADGPIANGVLNGDLVLYGTGDPTIADRFGMRRSVWQAFADTLLALGVTRVTGDLVGDASYFEGGTPEGWQTSYMNASYAAPSSALSYAENVATVQVAPAGQAGAPPQVTLVPGGTGIAVVNEATTTASGGSSIRIRRSSYDGPVVVSGRIARRASPVVRAVVVSDPERFAAGTLRYELEQRGITIDGTVRSVTSAAVSPVTGRSVFAPAFDQRSPVRVLAVHTSPPLIEILSVINQKSHNMMAEQALRTVGRVVTGEGSVAGGARGVQAMLARQLGEDVRVELTQHDGSGLSVLNRASALSFVQLLDAMARSPMWDNFWATLPEAGAPGGLRRMYRTAAEGNLRAKTGTINHVSALSGYLTMANGERVAFSILSNDVPSTWRAKRIEDGIGARLAGFTRPRGTVLAGAPVDAPMEPAPDITGETDELPAPEPAEAPAAEAEPARPATHTIQKGDTFEGIAKRYGVTVRALRAANPNLNPRRLLPGKDVRLP